jgi:hypothetical protein
MGSGGRGNILSEGLYDWVRQTVPLWNYTLVSALQLRKSTVSRFSRVVRHYYSCADLAVSLGTASDGLLIFSPPRPQVCDFSQPLIGTSAFQVAELRSSPHHLGLRQISQFVILCCRRTMEPRIIVDLPVTNGPSCVNAKTLGLQHL